MKFFQFTQANKIKLGIKSENKHIDLEAALQAHPKKELPHTLSGYMNGGAGPLAMLTDYVANLPKDASYILDGATMDWAPAITNPEKILCVGLNYKKHADETKAAYPQAPVIFNKFNNALSGHQAKVPVPETTKRLDHEVELGIIIGKQAKHITEAEALDYVFGYVTTNDLSARDTQKSSPQWTLAKSSDGFAPVGPYLVTKDEIANPNNLQVRTTVGEEVRQDSNTKDMIFSCEEIIAYLSNYMTLEPGDLIMTGTPEGVIIGKQPRESRVYLAAGDSVTVEVEGLGALTTHFM